MNLLFRVLVTCTFLFLITDSNAQDYRVQAQQQLAQFDQLIGTWEGDGWVLEPGGKKGESRITEEITYDLDRTIIRLRGVGQSEVDGEERTTHDAFGVLYYDPFQQKMKMNSWIARGMHTIADLELLDNGKIRWWFKAGNRTIRYTITLEEDTWVELGEMSSDDETWRPFFGMELHRIN